MALVARISQACERGSRLSRLIIKLPPPLRFSCQVYLDKYAFEAVRAKPYRVLDVSWEPELKER